MNKRHQWRFNVAQKLREPDTVIYLEFVRKALAGLPGVTEKPCYGTPGFYAGKKLFCRLREDGKTFVVYNPERDRWMDRKPDTFFITDHYLNTDYMLVDLESVVPEELAELLVKAWRSRATKKLITEYENN
ncbi:MAG TPA: MmcQ/YjbR family DNA-binding protein [Mucilaginibacter sp.]|nr:MmcQ/YjbR family DNA-binding protein [Mucilaginibacter sp.]